MALVELGVSTVLALIFAILKQPIDGVQVKSK